MSVTGISVNLSSTTLTLPIAVFGMMLGLAGCSNSSTPEENVDADTTTTAEQSGTEQEVAKNDDATAAGGQTVTIYSSRNEQLIKPLLDKYTEKTGVKIELVTDKTGPMVARLESERKNTAADMLLNR